MSKLETLSTQLVFHGEDIVNVLENNFLMHAAIWQNAKAYMNAKIAVYTAPRMSEGPIEWSMSITSPTGRKTYAVTQRTPEGSVTFQPG